MKHPYIIAACRLLRLRGITQAALAAQVKTSRAYVSRVLGGYERQGRTWERLRAVLPLDVVALLQAAPLPEGARQPRVERALSMSPAAIAKRRTRAAMAPHRRLSTDPQFPTLRAAIAQLPDARPPPRPVNPATAAFIHWRHHKSA